MSTVSCIGQRVFTNGIFAFFDHINVCAQLLDELDKLAALDDGANATTTLQNIQTQIYCS